jgi:glycosyltransferase involved in cell wall biosynthesis
MQGGVGDFSRELATALVALNHEVHVITREGCGVEGSHGTLTVHADVVDWGWRSYGRVMGLAREFRIEVLNIQYQAAAYDLHPAINLLPWRAKLSPSKRRDNAHPKIVVTFHDLKVPYLFPKAGPLRDWVVTQLAQKADAAIVTNHADELTLTARCGGRLGHVERIPIGSNIAPALPEDFERETWRENRGLPRDSFVLGFFGFFNARKGVETLIRALAALDRSYHLLFIGGTVGSSDATNRAFAQRMDALIADLGLDDRVHYTGYVPPEEVSAAFGALDLCVLPYADGVSFHHGTLMAALAHGQAIVSTQPPVGLSELVHGENMWLVPPEDPGALAKAIATLSADPELRRRIRSGAAELSTQFTWEHIAERTVDLFESVRRET